MKHPPIKRHASMQPFSRDHYAGLVQAQRLMRAAEDTAAARRDALASFLNAWRREIRSHFDEEERLLIPLIDDAGDVERLLDEHRTLRDFAHEAERQVNQHDPSRDWVRELGEMLRDHIRWEERELFGIIEQNADEQQMQSLGQQTQIIENSRDRDSCSTKSGNARRQSSQERP